MNRYVFVVVVLLAGCAQGPVSPTAPTAPSSSSNVPTQPAPPTGPAQCSSAPVTFPSPTRPARVYLGATTCPAASRFLLYDDGTFALQYVTVPGDYRGTYAERDGAIAFQWDERSNAGAWTADGTLTSETLSVHFNVLMQMDDFEDAVYTRVE